MLHSVYLKIKPSILGIKASPHFQHVREGYFHKVPRSTGLKDRETHEANTYIDGARGHASHHILLKGHGQHKYLDVDPLPSKQESRHKTIINHSSFGGGGVFCIVVG